MPHKLLNLIDGSISCYCYIINSPEWLDNISQSNELAGVVDDIESDILGGNKEKNKRGTKA